MVTQFLIKRGTEDDEIKIAQLLNELLPMGILSESPQKLRQVFFKYLLRNPLGLIVVAFEQDSGKGAGYVIAIRHPLRFWSTFILRYPLSAGLFLFIKKYKSMIKELLSLLKRPKKKNNFLESLGQNLPEFNWSPSSYKIARINFIGVIPDFRKLGLGQALYSFLAEVLKKEGCVQIEAHIDKDNKDSLRLHQKSGWQIEELCQGDYKAVLKL